MRQSFPQRAAVIRMLLFYVLAGAGWMLHAQDFNRARDLVARVQNDVQRAATFTANNQRERIRYEHLQQRLSQFDRGLSRNRWDKGRLNDAINDLKGVVRKNTLESHDRDALAMDLSDLRTLRDLR